MSFPPHQRMADAIRTTESEIEIVENERSAYRRFVRRLDSIDAPNSGPVTATNDSEMQVAAVESLPVGESLREAREAYRETVMGTPHYDREYSESLREHVNMEFGSSVASQFADSRVLTPLLQRSLRDGAAEAIRQRSELLKSLASELRSLQSCQDVIENIQQRIDEIYATLSEVPDTVTWCEIDDRLVTLESECERLLTRRQQHIDNRSGIHLTDDNTSFAKYLYNDLNSNFPVLSAVAECVETIRTCRIRTLR